MTRHRVVVPPDLVHRGREYGIEMVRFYEENPASMSAQVSGEWGAEKDPERQAHGKIGEVATALFFGLNPDDAVNWKTDKGGDGGVDLVLPWNGFRLDAKTTLPPFKLIWSRAVNHLYWSPSKAFDILVSVSINEDDWSDCWIEGWVTKEAFFNRKRIAAGGERGLASGTWFMEKAALQDAAQLLPSAGRPPEYFCLACGRLASFGFGRLGGARGRWFCREHKPPGRLNPVENRPRPR